MSQQEWYSKRVYNSNTHDEDDHRVGGRNMLVEGDFAYDHDPSIPIHNFQGMCLRSSECELIFL